MKSDRGSSTAHQRASRHGFGDLLSPGRRRVERRPNRAPLNTWTVTGTVTWTVKMTGDIDDGGPDSTLGPSESQDSDEVRNDDGDIVVDPPDEWIEPEEDDTLDEKLAAEVPDVLPPGEPPQVRPGRRTYGQIDGTPEDGDSFYTVAEDETDTADE